MALARMHFVSLYEGYMSPSNRTVAVPRPACRQMAAVALTMLCAGLGACTTVYIGASPDAVNIERRLGVLQVKVIDSHRAYVAEVAGVGLLDTPAGVTAGYARHTWVRGETDDCRVVLWIEDAAGLKTLENLLKQYPTLCAVPPPNHREGASQ